MIHGTLYTRRYPVGNLDLVIRTDIRQLFDSIDLLGGDTDGSGRRSIEVFILGRSGASAVSIDTPPDAEPIVLERRCRMARAEGVVYGEWYGRARSLTSPGGGFAVIGIPGLRGMNMRFIARAVIRPLLDRLVMDAGRVILHAAAAARGDAGFVLVGGAGSGKSTIVHGLVDRGWAFLGDDRVVLAPDDADRAAIHAFPEYIRHARTSSGPKHRIVPATTITQARPAALVFLEPFTGTPECVRLTPAAASARLVHAVPRPWNERAYEGVLDIVAATCASAECWSLRRGDDPALTIETVAALAG